MLTITFRIERSSSASSLTRQITSALQITDESLGEIAEVSNSIRVAVARND